jgi:hypothetical protein
MLVHTAPWSKGLIALAKQLSEAGPPAAKDAIRARIDDYMVIARAAYPEHFQGERTFDSATKTTNTMEKE